MIVGALRRLASALAFGGAIAAVAILVGVDDMESYEHAFFSLDRGTALQTIRVLGHPVFTLGLGLGVRLPLHGSLGASPVAALSPYLPVPVTYWLLIAFSIAAAVMVVRHALEPLCGRLVSWLAMVLLFASVPMVNYTIYADWPETAVTYCVIVACVFAPHALLALLGSDRSKPRRLAGLSLAALVWGLIGVSHPGYWQILAGVLVLTSILALCRSDYPFRTRLTVVAVIAIASLMAVALQVADIAREIGVAGGAAMTRFVDDPRGSLIPANMFPFGDAGERMPFTYLIMALVSLTLGLRLKDTRARALIVGGAALSVILGVAAGTLSPGVSVYAPSNTWGLRDPAAAFAVLSAACAAGAVRASGRVPRILWAGPALAALVIASLQGPAYAASLVVAKMRLGDRQPWTRDMTVPEQRASIRGLTRDRVSPGERLALWPGVRDRMRMARHASTDLADGGYLLVTAWTKQRTMRGLVEPNQFLFNQFINLAPQVLCDASAVQFLQLRHLLLPHDVECLPWTRVPGLVADEWLDVGVPVGRDDRVRALPAGRLSEPVARAPALSAGSVLLSTLVPLPGTSLQIEPRGVTIELNDPSIAEGQALVLPVAYDRAWRTSAGELQNVGGLLAVTAVDERRVVLDFVPDTVAVVRAVSMTVAQIFSLVGFLGLAYVRPA